MKQSFKLTESIGGFSEGEILDVTARFGNWHTSDLELQARSTPRAKTSKIVVTASQAGFSEAEILDPTARFGDWHHYDLKFTPVSGVAEVDASAGGVMTLTDDEFAAVAEPLAASR